MTSDGMCSRKGDATDSEGSCTICTEVYRDPRLLPCGHTFCSGCLERWHASGRQRHYFSCPICREKVKMPDIGVQGFRSNYFVPSQRDNESCSVCKTSNADVRRCSSCNQLLCQTCRTTHGSNKASTDGPSCRGQEDEIVPEEATAIRTAISVLRPVTRSCCYAEVIGGFQCSAEGSDVRVNKIVPVSASEAWVLFNNGPAIYRYNMNGMLSEVRCAVGKVIDMCVHPDGPLLVIEEYSNSVFVCGDNNTAPIEYVNLGDYRPTSFLVRDEGSMIVACKPVNESLLHVCHLLKFDKERNRTGINILRGEFRRISGLALNTYSNNVCTADMECRVVHVLLPNDTRVLTYRRSSAFPIRGGSDVPLTTLFTPRAVCSGLHDAFLVLDGGSGYIHVLDKFASLTGAVVMDDQEHTGSPNTIAVGRDERLWVGDGSDGKVKVYSLNTFINHLQPSTLEQDVNDRGVTGTGELHGTTSSVPEHFLSGNATLQQKHLVGMDVKTHYLSNDDSMQSLAGGLPHGSGIQISGGVHGISITLNDTGTPEGNIREREHVLRFIRENDVIRSRVEMLGDNADNLGPANFKFVSASDVQAQQFTPNLNQYGPFPIMPSSIGNFSLQHGLGLPNFLTGNRDHDLQFLDNFLKQHPAVRIDMESKGITPEMLVDFQSFFP